MTDDIVERLHIYANASIDGGWASVFKADLNIAADEIKQLRKERDEARQMYCKLWELPWRTGGIKKAKELGWDCFKDGDIQRQKILDEIKAAEMSKNDALDRLAKLDEELGLL